MPSLCPEFSQFGHAFVSYVLLLYKISLYLVAIICFVFIRFFTFAKKIVASHFYTRAMLVMLVFKNNVLFFYLMFSYFISGSDNKSLFFVSVNFVTKMHLKY